MYTQGQPYPYIHKIRVIEGSELPENTEIRQLLSIAQHSDALLSESAPEEKPRAMRSVKMRPSAENSWCPSCYKGIPVRQVLLYDFQCDLYFREK